jgi:hypothetical protein
MEMRWKPSSHRNALGNLVLLGLAAKTGFCIYIHNLSYIYHNIILAINPDETPPVVEYPTQEVA